MPTALTIAGSDSSGGAGVQADLKTFAAFGVFGTSVITAVTAQNTLGVTSVAPMSAGLVAAQLEAVATDLEIHAVKIGMLATAPIVEAVAAALDRLKVPIVLDPVIAASSGQRLLDAAGVQAVLSELLPRAAVVTPNIPEAEALSGRRIRTSDDRRLAARRIVEMGATAVVITGGHDPGGEVIDLVFDGVEFVELRTPRVADRPTHGTGCTFAAALAAGLTLGQTLPEAASRAQTYVAGAIAHAYAVGRGALALDHFWNVRILNG